MWHVHPLNQKQQWTAFTTDPRPIPTTKESQKQEEHGQRRDKAKTPTRNPAVRGQCGAGGTEEDYGGLEQLWPAFYHCLCSALYED